MSRLWLWLYILVFSVYLYWAVFVLFISNYLFLILITRLVRSSASQQAALVLRYCQLVPSYSQARVCAE